ncbi:GNAT family N-acetyltransferase [Halofilum ochraceum]|uniref:GNAT family N-acetyltransferase n=1 Tax=Halofilum ochraceum TaxID=1611323 RepID=UPI0008DAB47A|nr:GNAT family N-acetyltransferase [Halofilum ochraceum]
MNIREADADDLGLMLHWTALRHAGSIYHHVPFSEDRASRLLAWFMVDEDGLLIVCEHAGERIGGLAAQVMDSRFMEGRVALLWSLYAEKGRGGLAAFPLMRRYVEWAQSRGANLVEANNSASMDDEDFMKFAGRLGFKRSGSHAHLEV